MNNVSPSSAGKEGVENYVIGISAVLATCVTAGFAGVYFEKMLKDGGSTPFWVRNMQMYSCGVVSAALACMMESDDIAVRGFFHGYDEKVFAIVGFLSLGGVYISLVMKHLDNLHKSFASAFSIVIVVVVSLFIFPDVFIGAYFVLGAFLVISAILLYNSNEFELIWIFFSEILLSCSVPSTFRLRQTKEDMHDEKTESVIYTLLSGVNMASLFGSKSEGFEKTLKIARKEVLSVATLKTISLSSHELCNFFNVGKKKRTLGRRLLQVTELGKEAEARHEINGKMTRF
ncbi:unnamed protein product [Caenorhabditis auriculariae]|uniref:Uncharacterized protein n=1 Tax=Caenorhabditis auriculariae TaxID=2777116 RepID=A0A8S1HP09_9PELO|nr:unnamed protein product [Caenorhabditis auriculariae]